MSGTTTVELRGRAIAFSDTGGTGTPVILAHGFALDSTMFASQQALAPNCRVIAWDAPGHGESPVGESGFSYWDLAEIQLALMDVLGIDRAVVGGVSQGGFIALRTALSAPDRVAALVLIDTEAKSLDPRDAEGYDELFSAIASRGPAPDLVAALAGQIIGDHPAAQTWAQTWSQRGIPLGAPVECLLQRDDITGRLSEIAAAALVIAGELDQSIPIDRQEDMRKHLASPTGMNIIAGAGHSPPLTHPAPVNAHIADFLQRIRLE